MCKYCMCVCCEKLVFGILLAKYWLSYPNKHCNKTLHELLFNYSKWLAVIGHLSQARAPTVVSSRARVSL